MSKLDHDTTLLSPIHPARPRVIQEEQLCEDREDAMDEGGTSSKLVDTILSPMCVNFLSGNDQDDTDQFIKIIQNEEEPAMMEENVVADSNTNEDALLSEADEVSSHQGAMKMAKAITNSRYDDDEEEEDHNHQQQRNRNEQRRKTNRTKKHTLWLLTMLSSIVRVFLYGIIGCGILLVSIAVPYSCNFFSYHRITTTTPATMLDLNTRVLQSTTTNTPLPPCDNTKTEQFQILGRQEERTCGWYAYKNMCDSIVNYDDDGSFVYDVCQKSCGKCDSNEIRGRDDAPASSSLGLPSTTPSLTNTSTPPSQMVSPTYSSTSPTVVSTRTSNPTSTYFPQTQPISQTVSNTSTTPPSQMVSPAYSSTNPTTVSTRTSNPTSTYFPQTQPISQTVSQTVRAPSGMPVGQPVMNPQPSSQPVGQPISNPIVQPVVSPIGQPSASQPVSQPIVIPPSSAPVGQPVQQPVLPPQGAPVEQPVRQPVTSSSSLLLSYSYLPFEYLEEAGVGIFAYYMILPNHQHQDDDDDNNDDTGGGHAAIFYNHNSMCFLYCGDEVHPYSWFQNNYKNNNNQINTDLPTTTITATATTATKSIIDLWIVARYCSILAPIVGFIGMFLQFLLLLSECCYYYHCDHGSITLQRRRRHQEEGRQRDCCCCGSIATSIFDNRKRYSIMVVSSVILLVFASALQLGTFSIMFASPTMSSGSNNNASTMTLDPFCFSSLLSESQSSLYYYSCRFDTGAWLAFGAAILYILAAVVVSTYCFSRRLFMHDNNKNKKNRTDDDTDELTDDDDDNIDVALDNTGAFVTLLYHTVYPIIRINRRRRNDKKERRSSIASEECLNSSKNIEVVLGGGDGGNTDRLCASSTTSSAPVSQWIIKKEQDEIHYF